MGTFRLEAPGQPSARARAHGSPWPCRRAQHPKWLSLSLTRSTFYNEKRTERRGAAPFKCALCFFFLRSTLSLIVVVVGGGRWYRTPLLLLLLPTKSNPAPASSRERRARPAAPRRRSVTNGKRVSLAVLASVTPPPHANVYLESLLQVLIQLQDRRHVAAPVAVVRRGPDRHERVVEHRLVALHH